MVGRVPLLLLCCILGGIQAMSNYERITKENEIQASAQIHWQYCHSKFNCLIPSKYFHRVEEHSLYMTSENKIQFLDGIEIYAVSNTTWHLTVMANNSDSSVKFIWADKTLVTCNNETKEGDEMFKTPDSTITALSRDLTFPDPKKDGNLSDAMICKYKLEKNPNLEDDRTIAVIFSALVQTTREHKMCLEIEGVFSEKYCNFIKDLEKDLHLSFNPPICTNCKVADDFCRNFSMCRERWTQGMVAMTEDNGCDVFSTPNHLRVNNKFYAKQGTQVICHHNRWFMLRDDPMPAWEQADYSEELYLDEISSVMDDMNMLCEYSSPLKSYCKQGTDCMKVTWEAVLQCEANYELSYYRSGSTSEPLKLIEARCHELGYWYGIPLDPKANVTYTLRAGGNIVCKNPNQLTLQEEEEEEGIDLEEGKKKGGEQLRRDDAFDYTSGIALIAVVAVLFIILMILICVVCASCIGQWAGKPVGLKGSEKSQRPISAAGEEERSFYDRLSLVFT